MCPINNQMIKVNSYDGHCNGVVMIFFLGHHCCFRWVINGFTAILVWRWNCHFPLPIWYLSLSLSLRWSGHVSSSLVASTHHWAGYPFPWWCSPWIIDIILPLGQHCTHSLATVSQIICGEHKIFQNISRKKTCGDHKRWPVDCWTVGQQVKIRVFWPFWGQRTFLCLSVWCLFAWFCLLESEWRWRAWRWFCVEAISPVSSERHYTRQQQPLCYSGTVAQWQCSNVAICRSTVEN